MGVALQIPFRTWHTSHMRSSNKVNKTESGPANSYDIHKLLGGKKKEEKKMWKNRKRTEKKKETTEVYKPEEKKSS